MVGKAKLTTCLVIQMFNIVPFLRILVNVIKLNTVRLQMLGSVQQEFLAPNHFVVFVRDNCLKIRLDIIKRKLKSQSLFVGFVTDNCLITLD